MAKRLNGSTKRARKVGALRLFLKQYARKAQSGWDPNDRSYDRRIEARIKRMQPTEFDRLVRDEDD
jgi:hypothetical protein